MRSQDEHRGGALSANALFRGTYWTRALARVNRKVLVPDQLRDTQRKVVARVHDGDRAVASDCKLPIVVGADAEGRAIHKIEIPEHARVVPGSRSPSLGHAVLFNNAQLHVHAALLGTATTPDVVGVMVEEKREVFMHSFLVRLLQVLVTLKLAPPVHAKLPHTVLAYRPIDGVRAGLFMARSLMRRGFIWGARADIRSFFPSVRTQHVAFAFPKVLPVDDSLLQLLAWMMSAPIVRGVGHPLVKAGQPVRSAPLHGLYQGSSIAPVLSNVVGAAYFDIPFAVEMKGQAILLRYADDLLVLARDRQVAREGLDLVHALVRSHGFQLHDDPAKTSVEPIDLRGAAFVWLGYELGYGAVRLPATTFDQTIARLVSVDARDPRTRSTFIEAVLKLSFDRGYRLDDLREAMAVRSDAHFDAIESAMVHVKNNIRGRWIATWQRFADPVLREVSY